MKKSLFTLIFLLAGLLAVAQNNISGSIIDSSQGPVIGATIELKTLADSPVSVTFTDDTGVFVFPEVANGTYKLDIEYSGFEPFSQQVTVNGADVDMGNLKLTPEVNTLSGVQIVGTAAPVLQNGDTTQFNANSFKTNPDATAEDLIRKMPGMDNSSGQLKAQGEQVTKVLVDGKPFFGDDPTTTLRNLPAEIVDKIQVYDEGSEQAKFTGFDDGQTTKTVNIITKGETKEGSFGRAYAGYGYEDKYNVGGNVNLFKNDRRLTLIGQANNINVQNFDAQDLVGISGSSGGRGGGGFRGGGMRGGSNSGSFNVGQQNGISQTNAAGVNYSNKFFNKKLDFTASYFFNNSNNTTEQDINRSYILAQNSGQAYSEYNRNHSENYNHRLNMRMDYDIDSNNSILFIPSVSFQKNNSESILLGQTSQGTDALNSTSTSGENQREGWNASAQLLYRHKFAKAGRTLSINANPSYSSNVNDGKYRADNIYNTTPSLNDTLDQDFTNQRYNGKISSRLTYTEPLGEKIQLQGQYEVYYSQSDADKQTYNYNDGTAAYTDFDSLLSNKFNSNYISHRPGVSMRLRDSNFTAGLGVNYQYATLNSERVLPYSFDVSRNFQSVLPYVFMRYKISRSKNLRLFFRTGTNEPAVEQLQDVIDNSNPLQLSSGNPFLVQAYESSVRAMYSAANAGRASNFLMAISGSNQHNYITNSTVIATNDTLLGNGVLLPSGSQFMQPVNMKGYWNVNAFANYGQMIKPIKVNANVNLGLGYVRTLGLINNRVNISENKNVSLGVVLSSNISENIDFTVSSNSTMNFVSYSLNSTSNNNYFNQLSRASVNYIFLKSFVFSTDITHQLYTGLSQSFNQSFALWNMSVAKKFLKNQAEVRLSVFDLLNQNNNISRSITELYIQDTRTNNLQRYFMLTFSYKFRNFKGGSEKDFMRNEDNRMPPGMPPPQGGSPGHGGPGGMF